MYSEDALSGLDALLRREEDLSRAGTAFPNRKRPYISLPMEPRCCPVVPLQSEGEFRASPALDEVLFEESNQRGGKSGNRRKMVSNPFPNRH